MTEQIKFSLNLVELALNHLEFLEFVDHSCTFYFSDVASKAAYRYEKYWLPFYAWQIDAGENPENLYPSYDVAWIWHCHLLSPTDYRKDCMQVCGKVLDHFCLSKSEIEKRQQYTKKLWDKSVPSPFHEDSNIVNEPGFVSKIGYNLVDASDRQKKFFYNVCLPHFKSKKYLELCLERYKKFIVLKQRNPELFIVPCFGIDLIWHTHQLNPIIYAENTIKYLTRILPHDDTVSDRSPDSSLTNSLMKTKEAWRISFNENFNFAGGMYRGDAPYFSSDFSNKSIDLIPLYESYNGTVSLQETK